MTTINLSPEAQLDLADFDEAGFRLAIFGSSGSGKGWLLGCVLEDLIAAGLPVIMLDPEHELWTFKEAGAVVIGGAQQDHPFVNSPEGIDSVLTFALQTATPVVFDIHQVAEGSELDAQRIGEKIMRRLWILLDQPEWRRQCVFACTEAAIFAPEQVTRGGEVPQMLRQFFARGRKRGLISAIETQRTQQIQKAVISQANVRLIGRLDDTGDYDAVKRHLPAPTPEGKAQRLVPFNQMRLLSTGTFIRGGTSQRFTTRARRVTHGGGTPPPGESIQIRSVGRRSIAQLGRALHRAEASAQAAIEPPGDASPRAGRKGAGDAALRRDLTNVRAALAQSEAHLVEEREGRGREREETQETRGVLEARVAELEPQVEAIAPLRDALQMFLGNHPGPGVAPGGDGVSRELVRQMIEEHAPSGNGATPALPVEQLKQSFLERAAQRIFERVRNLDDTQRDVLLYLLAHPTQQTNASIARVLTGQAGGSAHTRIGETLRALEGAGLIEHYKSGNNRPWRPAITATVARELQNASSGEIDEVVNRALHLLQHKTVQS